MLDSDFQGAGQDKITLHEKNFHSKVKFLKVLYPSSMFGGARVDLDDESLLSVLALADELVKTKSLSTKRISTQR